MDWLEPLVDGFSRGGFEDWDAFGRFEPRGGSDGFETYAAVFVRGGTGE